MANWTFGRVRAKHRYRVKGLEQLERRDVPAGLLMTGAGTPTASYTLPTVSGPSSELTAETNSTETPALVKAASALTLTRLQRIARYDPTTGLFVPVTANDPNLVGKNIKVLVHGWAPGYLD